MSNLNSAGMPAAAGGFTAIRGDAGTWAALSLLLNLVWEVVQLPLYTLIDEQPVSQVIYAIAHCTVGDVLIAMSVFLLTCAILRRSDWAIVRPWAGFPIVAAAGVAYTAWSEYRNVYQAGTWAYAAGMPLVFGIGLSPLLQWLVVPALTLAAFRVLRVRCGAAPDGGRSGAPRSGPAFERHDECSRIVAASVEAVFAHADDFRRLSSHMSGSSWMMAGVRMEYTFDDGGGRTVGAIVRMHGNLLGVGLALEERVIERLPPQRKVWMTTAPPQLLVIGSYRMGFDVTDRDGETLLSVFIDYDLPAKWPARGMGHVFAGMYARWCTRRMADDTVRHFLTM